LALTYLWLAVIEAARLKRYRLLLAAAPLAGLAVVFWLRNPLRLAFDVPSAPDALGFRYAVWRNAIDMIRDHPWLGVGAGNYTAALRADYRSPGVFLDAHAHNTILHVAVESGIPALIAFLVVWYRVFRFGYERGLGGNLSAIVMVGSIGALAAFAVRSIGEHFLSGLPSSDRMSFLVWTLLAAATALYQWNQTDARAART
jgi:O-antigen ligase